MSNDSVVSLAAPAAVSDRTYIVDRGRNVFTGTVEEFDADEEVARRYVMVAG